MSILTHERLRHARPVELKRMLEWDIRESAVDTSFVRTPDGWELAINHYRQAGHPARHELPVLLCHGLGSNRLAYDIQPDLSLPRWLVEQGYDVYVLELRGHGLSQKPSTEADHHWGWGMHDYSDLDIPTAIQFVLKHTGKPRLHYIGHSMGGILLYKHAAQQRSGVQSGIAIGSSLNYAGQPTLFHTIVPLAPLTHLFRAIPLHWSGLLTGKLAKLHQGLVDPSFVNPANIDRTVFSKLMHNVLHPVSPRVLRDLSHAITGKGMRNRQGKKYESLLAENGYPFPILAISGEADTQCAPCTAARFGTAHQSFGKVHGHREDYGHHDLLVGRHAAKEVWPVILQWLDQNDELAEQRT